ncbi:MAG: response regulator [Lachnospiraceae bacterium]|nr:response regulator [Lachnospiraceae bacterium]
MANILMVQEGQTYLATNIKAQLEALNYEVFTSALKVQTIYDNLHDPEAILLYVSEDFEEHIQELLYVKDKAVEAGSPIFLMGEEHDLDKFSKHIDSLKIAGKFSRPIDVKKVAFDVDMFVQEHGRQNKKKILVVDDSGAVLRNVKGWLEDKYNLTLANSGATAIKSLSLNRPDLVLLDYEMPVVDGAQVLEMIRTENDFHDIPVIFLTSKGDKESVMKVMALKPEGYLLKTLPPAEIIAQIDEFFEKQRMKEF